MKIFLCLKNFLPEQVAGTEIYVLVLAKWLQQKGNNVAVIKPNYSSGSFTNYVYDGINVLEYPEEATVTKSLIIGNSYPKGVKAFKELLQQEQPDCVHFHEISGSNGITIQHYRIAAALGITVYTTLHLVRYVCKTSTLLYKDKYPCDGVIKIDKCAACLLHERGINTVVSDALLLTGKLLKDTVFDLRNKSERISSLLDYPGYIERHKKDLEEIFSISKKVFVLNSWFRRILNKNGLPLEKITVLPRALPLKILYKNDSLVQPAKKINAANIKLVYVGRISKIKGLYLLLSVLDKLKEKNWQLDIYGKVTEESYYQQCLALTEQNKAISWKGVVAPAEVINTLKGYDLLVSPSLVQEMSPLITLEAFAAGIPVLASDVLANREEITEGKNGWLYTLNSKHSLNKKLEYILGNPSVLKQAAVHLPVLKTFEMVADIHLKIYASDKNKDLTDQKSGKKIKVLHCLNHFLPGHTAGTEVYTWALCKGLQQEGIESEVAIPGYGMDATVTHYYDGIAVHEYAEPSTVDRNLQMGFTLPEGLNYFTELVKKINPDIVHFHELAGSNGFTVSHIEAVAALQFKTMMTFHLASYTCKAKTLLYKDKAFCDGVIDEYKCSECMIATHSSKLIAWPLSVYSKFHFLAGINLSRYPSKLATALGYPFIIKKLREDFYRLDNSCNKLVVLTDWYKKILIANGIAEEKIFLNKQGLVQQQLNEATLMRKPSVALKLVFVGRISHFKGVHLILEALKGMNENKVSLDVYGPEPEDDYAESCKKIMDSMKQVSFKGKLEPDQVVHTMAQYDALVLASTFSEMSPLVIQEAFAAGIPVIASNVYGNAEQVKNGINGWLFKFNDAVDLQKKIETIIANPEILKEAKANIPVPVPRKFENVVDEYIQLYKSMVLVKD